MSLPVKLPQLSDREATSQLTDHESTALQAGEHLNVAAQLAARGRSDLAGWVYEQIWDYRHAVLAYVRGKRASDALRAALLANHAGLLEQTVELLLESPFVSSDELCRLGQWLAGKKRSTLAARLLHHAQAPAQAVAQALDVAGDTQAAIEHYLEGGDPMAALRLLQTIPGMAPPQLVARKAQALWQLGDVEGAVVAAQEALARGCDTPWLRSTLAQALVALGHPLAAHFVAEPGQGHDFTQGSSLPQQAARYRVLASAPAVFSGVSYFAHDRSTLQDVEIHLLAADVREIDHPSVQDALTRFSQRARAGAQLGHPAIRPILALDAREGVLVLPQSVGPGLRAWIRPPGLHEHLAHVIAMAVFLGEGLICAHAQGLVHGSLLPSQIASDALGRPLLGPFGAHLLAGLNATRTGTLEELLSLCAPEARTGVEPTTASDVFALGRLIEVLLVGSFSGEVPALPPAIVTVLDAMCQPDPKSRPTIETAVDLLRHGIDRRSVFSWQRAANPHLAAVARLPENNGLLAQKVVQADASWPEAILEQLAVNVIPGAQVILDRDGHNLTLLAWPANANRSPIQLVENHEFEELFRVLQHFLPPLVFACLHGEASQAALVRLLSGEWMLDLEGLLTAPYPTSAS